MVLSSLAGSSKNYKGPQWKVFIGEGEEVRSPYISVSDKDRWKIISSTQTAPTHISFKRICYTNNLCVGGGGGDIEICEKHGNTINWCSYTP